MSESEEVKYTSFQEMIDAAKAAGGSSEAPTVGTHQGVVRAAKYKPSKGGKLGISILLQVTEPGENMGRQIWSNQYLTPGPNMQYFFKTFEGLGIPMSFWAQFGLDKDGLAAAGVQVATLIKGAPAKFSVKMGEWNGEPKPEVGFIGKGSGAGLDATPAAAPVAVAPLGAAPLTPAPARPF